VVEFDGIVDEETLYHGVNVRWRECVSTDASHLDYKDVFMRKVCGAGEALTGMQNNTQLEFWDEPTDEVEKVLHYVIRDVLQGIEGWVSSLQRKEDVFDFCDAIGGMKRHRTYGKWRKKVVDDATEDTVESEEKDGPEGVLKSCLTKGDLEWSVLRSMDNCLHTSRHGDMQSTLALTQLIGCTNRSQGVLCRLKKVVTWIAA